MTNLTVGRSLGAVVLGAACSVAAAPAAAALSMALTGGDVSHSVAPGEIDATVLHGSVTSGGTAVIDAGPHPCIGGCLNELVPPIGFGRGEIDASTGHFQLYAGTLGGVSGGGSAELNLFDTLLPTGPGLFGTVTFDIHIDLTLTALRSSGGAQAYSEFTYSILGLDSEGQYSQNLFTFTANRYDTMDFGISASYGVDGDFVQAESGSSIPSVYETSFDVPLAIVAGMPFQLTISGGGGCDYIADCGTAHARSVNSAYLGIRGDVTSQSGYTYLGYSAVPLPSAIWLFGSGMLGLFCMRQRRRTHQG